MALLCSYPALWSLCIRHFFFLTILVPCENSVIQQCLLTAYCILGTLLHTSTTTLYRAFVELRTHKYTHACVNWWRAQAKQNRGCACCGEQVPWTWRRGVQRQPRRAACKASVRKSTVHRREAEAGSCAGPVAGTSGLKKTQGRCGRMWRRRAWELRSEVSLREGLQMAQGRAVPVSFTPRRKPVDFGVCACRGSCSDLPFNRFALAAVFNGV